MNADFCLSMRKGEFLCAPERPITPALRAIVCPIPGLCAPNFANFCKAGEHCWRPRRRGASRLPERRQPVMLYGCRESAILLTGPLHDRVSPCCPETEPFFAT